MIVGVYIENQSKSYAKLVQHWYNSAVSVYGKNSVRVLTNEDISIPHVQLPHIPDKVVGLSKKHGSEILADTVKVFSYDIFKEPVLVVDIDCLCKAPVTIGDSPLATAYHNPTTAPRFFKLNGVELIDRVSCACLSITESISEQYMEIWDEVDKTVKYGYYKDLGELIFSILTILYGDRLGKYDCWYSGDTPFPREVKNLHFAGKAAKSVLYGSPLSSSWNDIKQRIDKMSVVVNSNMQKTYKQWRNGSFTEYQVSPELLSKVQKTI